MASFLSRVYQFVKLKSILRLSAKTEGSGLTLSVTFFLLKHSRRVKLIRFLVSAESNGGRPSLPLFHRIERKSD
jgi:hypothetical protein